MKTSTAATLGGLLGAPAILGTKSSAASPGDTIKVGVIGCGGRGSGAARDALNADKNVIIAAHGNSLRALVMILEGLSGDEILQRELATGAPILYRLGADGRAIDRKDLLPPRSLAAAPEDRII